MKSKTGFPRISALETAFFLILLTAQGYGANFILGYGAGYSGTLAKTQYDRSFIHYSDRELKTCYTGSIGFGDGHLGLLGEVWNQEYDEVSHWMNTTRNVASIMKATGNISRIKYPQSFQYIGVSVEYRLNKDIRKILNPYLRLGVYALFYLDLFGSGPPEYPKTVSGVIALGTRLRLIGAFYFNPRVVYLSGNSSMSIQAGLDLIL